MTAENTRPNFFILLGLNPDAPWDEGKFEQALRDKRIEWSRQGSSIGIKALQAKKNLEMIPEIRRVMTDPALRSAQAAGAKTEQLSNRKTRLDTFERQLAFAESKGYLEQSELEKLTKEFHDVLSEQEIAHRLKVKVQVPTAQTTKTIQQLDPSIVKDIADKLKAINKSNLYDLLDMPETTSTQELSTAAQQLYDDMVRRQPKTAEVTARSDLAGHAKNIFKSDEMRRRYDDTLRQSTLTSLLKELDESIGRTTEKVVYAQQVLMFLDAASKAGWKPEISLAKLREHARERKWPLELPTNDEFAQKQRCGFCHAMNEKGRNFCRECNKDLRITCPNCGQSVPSDEEGCGRCGFPVGNRYLVDVLLEECGIALRSSDLKTAQDRLTDAERAWFSDTRTGFPSKPDARMQKIRECKAEIERLAQLQQRNLEQMRTLINQRLFFSAREFLATHPGLPDSQMLQHTIDARITHAENLLKQAQLANRSQEEKADLALQALRTCVDYQDARSLLNMIPPAPPGNLQAILAGASVSLTWDISPSYGVQYKVVRKSHSQPVRMKDGQALDTVTGRTYVDTKPEIGVPLFYAVFATYDVYEDLPSAQSVILARPMLLIDDVKNVTVRIDDSRVDLAWKAPPNVHSVVIVRKEHSRPNSISDGKRFTALDSKHFVDREVQNNCSYFYGIYCQFKDHNADTLTSPGVFAEATPESPPEVIIHLEIVSTKKAQGQEVILRWNAPNKGDVVILKSTEQLSLRMGDIIAKSELELHGQILESRQNTAIDLWEQPGMGYYLPVVLFREMAYIGAAQRYLCVDDIGNLKVDNIGTALRAQWNWPANCQEAIVAFSYDDYPDLNAGTPPERQVNLSPRQGSANIYQITRAQYDLHGHYDIKGAMNRDHFITVAAVIRQGTEQIITPGARIQKLLASKVVLSYEIKPPAKFVRKQYTLHLHTPVPRKLPALVIISKCNGLPLNKADGEPFYRLEQVEPFDKDIFFPLPVKMFPPNTFGKLFLEDDRLYEVVNVHHPGIDKLRLG